MKPNTNMQQWIPSALVGLALAASTSLGLAANITYTFDSDTQGWGTANGDTAVVWDSAHNRGGGGGGCLQYTLVPVPGTNNTLAASVDVDYDTTSFFDVEFDMMIDATSGTDGSGGYGNMQIGDFDAAYNWHGEWYGSVGGPGGNFSTWRHVKIPFAAAYGPRAHLQILLQSASGDYNGNVIVYIDNVVFQDGTPPNKVFLENYAWPEECVSDNTWGSGPPVWSQDTTLLPAGSLKVVVNYGDPGNTGWQDGPGEFHDYPAPYDPSKFTYLDCDVYLDAPTGLPSYGQLELASWYGWSDLCPAMSLSEANIGKWTHYSGPLNHTPGATQGLVIHPGGNNMSGVFTYYIANVTMWSPASPPTITALKKDSGVQGAEITMNQSGPANQWQRDSLCIASGSNAGYTWVGNPGMTYSFTIASFPDPVVHHGYEAHLYIVNEDTVPDNNGPYNETYGGCDWNVADILEFRIENTADRGGGDGPGVIVHIDWKTNLPNANPLTNAIYHPVNMTAPTAIGTWTLQFTSDTDGTVTGPGGVSTNFSLPPETTANFNPDNSFIQFGIFKNDGAADGHNDGVSGTFSAVSFSGSPYGTSFSDDFSGPGLTANYAWRTTSGAVQWVPGGTAWWLTWTTPDDGYSMKVSGDVGTPMASWADAGITYTYVNGVSKSGAVPAASLPAGNAAFFRLVKP